MRLDFYPGATVCAQDGEKGAGRGSSPRGGVPPLAVPDDLEAVLGEIWMRHFSPRRLDANAHLLSRSIGGRRLIRFLKEIEANIGYKIPPTALLRLGTLRALTSAIRAGAWPPPSPLVLLRDGDADNALFVVSLGDGIILNMCDIVAGIDFPGRIWGLQLPGLDGEAEPLTSVPDMARHYVDALMEHPNPGAYHLIGYSFGGLVAVEVARQLMARGRRVGLLGLLDTGCCDKYWPRTQWALFTARKALRRGREICRLTPSAAAEHIRQRILGLLRHFSRRATASASSPRQSVYYIAGLEPDFQRVRDASIIAYDHHDPAPIDCRIVLFRSALGDHHGCNPASIWRRRTCDLEVVPVPGSHYTMIHKPFADILAAEISRQLARFRIAP